MNDLQTQPGRASDLEDVGAERRLRKLLRHTADSIVVIDDGGRVITREGRSILGYRDDEDPEVTIFELVHPDDLDRARQVLVQSIGHPEQDVTAELRVRHASGNWMWIGLTIVNLVDDPDVHGLLLTTRNIDAVKTAELELARARDEALAQSEAKSAFVATTSHELRTPLHGILGLAEVLTDAGLDEELSLVARSIRSEAVSLRRILDDLLDFSRIEAGHIEVSPAPFDLHELLHRLEAMFRPAVSSAGLELGIHVARRVPAWLLGDVHRIQQVLVNLLGNALKFTPSGHIDLDVTAARQGVVFRVSDSGSGIDPELQAAIFKPFVQGRPAVRQGGGAGLGLSIAAALVERMGGRIELSSLIGQGSTFVVHLPLDAAQPVRPVARPPRTASAAHGRRILVVEDNRANQMVVRRQLTTIGVDAVVVGDGETALHTVATGDFDAILMDWHMPGMDGLEVTQRIRTGERYDRREPIPIIGLTAAALPQDVERCLAAGMNEVISKPVERDDLEAALARWLRRDDEPLPIIAADPTAPRGAADLRSRPSDDDDEIFEPDVLTALADDLEAPDVVVAIVHAYLDDLDTRQGAICAALDGDDGVDLYRAAHTLRSPSALVGATGLVLLCRRIEEWATRDDGRLELGPGARAGLSDALVTLGAQTRDALEHHLARDTAIVGPA